MPITEFIIKSWRGGMNNSDPAIALPEDQTVLAQNTECYRSMLGERRRGTTAISLPTDISARDRVTFLYRHLPTSDQTAGELWVLGVTGTSLAKLARKTTSWTTISIQDVPVLTGFAPYRWQAQSLHGKLFFAFYGDVDRMRLWDGGLGSFPTSLRRAGLLPPAAAPTAADGGSGTMTGTRYYRQRYTVQISGVTTRRSEPSEVLTHTPSGSGDKVTITKAATTSESETHWELEASLNNADFYVIGTIAVASTTRIDQVDYVEGYTQQGYILSPDIGDYTYLPSCRYLIADEDRLILMGNWHDPALDSRVLWTPVGNAEGVGNDERYELDTDPTINLDGYEGGPITGGSKATGGGIWVFKYNHIYKLIRTGDRQRAYDVVVMSKERGALHGSVVSGVDQLGRPCVYFLDPTVGPCRAGAGGIQQCGADIRVTWESLNVDATKVVCVGVYDPVTRQVQWSIATTGSNVPDTMIVLQTNETREMVDGVRRGWSIWTGNRAKALAMCLYADNIDANAARSLVLRPFIGLEGLGLIHRCDTGTTDNGVEYSARIVSKPYTPVGILNYFGVLAGALMMKAVSSVTLAVKAIRDFGLETLTLTGITSTPTASETQVMRVLDNLSFSHLQTVQFEVVDPGGTQARWELNQLAIKGSTQQKN